MKLKSVAVITLLLAMTVGGAILSASRSHERYTAIVDTVDECYNSECSSALEALDKFLISGSEGDYRAFVAKIAGMSRLLHVKAGDVDGVKLEMDNCLDRLITQKESCVRNIGLLKEALENHVNGNYANYILRLRSFNSKTAKDSNP